VLRAWLELARISNLPTVWTNVLAGWLLAGGDWQWGPLAWLLVGGSMLYTAGMILNDAMDVKFDREHRKERPIPSGRVTAGTAWTAGIAMLLVGAGACFFGAGTCGWLVLALAAAIVAYDAFHKPWAGSVFIMGSCRALLYLVAGSAVTGGLSWEANQELVVKAVALGGYIVGVTLIARHESKAAGSFKIGALLGLVCLVLPLLVGAAFHLGAGTAEIAPFILLPAFVIGHARNVMQRPPPSNIGRAVGLLLANIVLIDALSIGAREGVAALLFAASMPLLLLWQRKIAAT
jgi:4-hydroxybenzoate polyprenyltransferase